MDCSFAICGATATRFAAVTSRGGDCRRWLCLLLLLFTLDRVGLSRRGLTFERRQSRFSGHEVPGESCRQQGHGFFRHIWGRRCSSSLDVLNRKYQRWYPMWKNILKKNNDLSLWWWYCGYLWFETSDEVRTKVAEVAVATRLGPVNSWANNVPLSEGRIGLGLADDGGETAGGPGIMCWRSVVVERWVRLPPRLFRPMLNSWADELANNLAGLLMLVAFPRVVRLEDPMVGWLTALSKWTLEWGRITGVLAVPDPGVAPEPLLERLRCFPCC